MLEPGKQVTQIVLWQIDDPTKDGDPRFWWPSEQPFELPHGRKLSGPKGISLAELRRRAGGDEVELDGPRTVRLSTAAWGGSDPDRTYAIVVHRYRPTPGEVAAEKARRGDASPFPPAAEAVRQKWLAALEAGDPTRAAELKAELDEQLGAHGWRKPYADPSEGVEIQPGVFLLDARPQARA